MKKNDLFDAIGKIDELYLKESESEPKIDIKVSGVGIILAAAASFMLIIGTVMIFSHFIGGTEISPGDTDGTVLEQTSDCDNTDTDSNVQTADYSEAIVLPDGINMVTIDGIRVPIPADSSRYLGFDNGKDSLLTIFYAPEKSKSGEGEILKIIKYTAVEFEQKLLMSNPYAGGSAALAVNGEWYYVMTVPTWITGDPTDAVFASVADECRKTVMELFAELNGFTAIDTADFYSREFTYDSEHVYFRFYPYGKSTDFYHTFVLSQPAKQGDGGIWCVERWYSMNQDGSGHIHIEFPDSGDLTALEYYVQLQMQYDNGELQTLGDPLETAIAWGIETFGADIIYAGHLEQVEALPEGEYSY